MGPVRGLLKDRRGAIAVMLAAATPMLIGSVGLGVDTVQWTMAKRLMQRQADSAALAGAYGIAQGQSVTAAVNSDLSRNARVVLTAPPVIERGPSRGPFAGDPSAVRVALSTVQNLPFTSLFVPDGVTINVEATAAVAQQGDYCALALEDQSVVGITMSGNTTVDFRCGMATNSRASNAVDASGSATIFATPIQAVGGLSPSNAYKMPTTLIPYAIPQRDPLAELPNPTGFGAPQNGTVNSNQTRTLNPGTYNGMNIRGTAILNPGVYLIDGGEFRVNAQATVRGENVTIVLTSQTAASNPGSIATVTINGGATMDLTAPTTGTYKGVLFYQDRRATNASQTNKINGNSSSRFQGAIYFPGTTVEFTGTQGMVIDCVQLVARRLSFIGNSTVRNVCPPGYQAGDFTGTAVRLVG
ncbi:MAG: pilus assembly protein TadG-related protein [Sphingomonadaceae bacterium]